MEKMLALFTPRAAAWGASAAAALLSGAAGLAAVCADTLKAAPKTRVPMSKWVLICFITEGRFMLALPRSVGSRVIVLPILGASFELLSPAVLVAGFPVGLGEHLHACACVRRGIELRLASQLLSFVATGCEACHQKQNACKTCDSFQAAHDLAPFASVLLP